jgi:hypothetical protein
MNSDDFQEGRRAFLENGHPCFMVASTAPQRRCHNRRLFR